MGVTAFPRVDSLKPSNNPLSCPGLLDKGKKPVFSLKMGKPLPEAEVCSTPSACFKENRRIRPALCYPLRKREILPHATMKSSIHRCHCDSNNRTLVPLQVTLDAIKPILRRSFFI